MAKDPVIWLAASVRKLLDRVAALEAALAEAKRGKDEFQWNVHAKIFVPAHEAVLHYLQQETSEVERVSPVGWGIGCGSANPTDVDLVDHVDRDVQIVNDMSEQRNHVGYEVDNQGAHETCGSSGGDEVACAGQESLSDGSVDSQDLEEPMDDDAARDFWVRKSMVPGCFQQYLLAELKQLPNCVHDVSEMEVSRLFHSVAGSAMLHFGEGKVRIELVANLSMNAIHQVLKQKGWTVDSPESWLELKLFLLNSVVSTIQNASGVG